MASSLKTAALVGGALSYVLLVNCSAPLDGAPAAPHCYLETGVKVTSAPAVGNQAHAGRILWRLPNSYVRQTTQL